MVQLEAAQQYFYGTGKRKTAIARVRLYVDNGGPFIVNSKPMDEYFGWSTWQRIANDAFHVTNMMNRFRVVAKVAGGGVNAQAEAVRHGITRALIAFDPSLKPALEARRFRYPRRPHQGKQKVRPQARPPRPPVHQAVSSSAVLRPSTTGKPKGNRPGLNRGGFLIWCLPANPLSLRERVRVRASLILATISDAPELTPQYLFTPTLTLPLRGRGL